MKFTDRILIEIIIIIIIIITMIELIFPLEERRSRCPIG
jgi:hypothetical protein